MATTLRFLLAIWEFIKHWFAAYFFGMMLLFSLALLIYNVRATKKAERGAEYNWLNAYAIVLATGCMIVLFVVYG